MRNALLAALFALVVGALTTPARAEDPPAVSPTKALLAEIEAAKTAKDDGKWLEGLKKIPALYADADEADKKALVQAGGHGLKAKTDAVQIAALEALVATKDAEAAWKAMKGEMPDEKAESAKPFSIKVMETLPGLHPEAAVSTLVSLLHNAKDPVVSARAATALGAYERSKQRVKILDELISAIRKAMPSGGGGRSGKAGGGATPRWTELGGAAGAALNALTGQAINSIPDWLKFYDENKKKPALIFKTELD